MCTLENRWTRQILRGNAKAIFFITPSDPAKRSMCSLFSSMGEFSLLASKLFSCNFFMGDNVESSLFFVFFRVDPKVPKPSPHGDVPPLQLAIWSDCMDIWNILAEHVELSDQDKLNQLYIMIQARFNESDQVFKTFNNLLSSLPVELV